MEKTLQEVYQDCVAIYGKNEEALVATLDIWTGGMWVMYSDWSAQLAMQKIAEKVGTTYTPRNEFSFNKLNK